MALNNGAIPQTDAPLQSKTPMTEPALIDLPPFIETERLRLRSLVVGDGPLLHEAITESLPELRRFPASLPWATGEQLIEKTELYCRMAQSNFISRQDLPFLIIERSSGRLIGCAGLHRLDWSVPKAELGYWCRTSQTGRGLMTEAVRALSRLAISNLGSKRLEIIVDEENQPARKVAERCGFDLEGILRRERRAPDGSLRNTCVYAYIQRRSNPLFESVNVISAVNSNVVPLRSKQSGPETTASQIASFSRWQERLETDSQ